MKNVLNIIYFVILVQVVIGCKNDVLPKPKGYLDLQYPQPKYVMYNQPKNYSFQYNSMATIAEKNTATYTIEYPKLKATVYINYRPVQHNITALLRDAQKLTYEHVVKADNITEQPYINKLQRKYGMFYEVGGNAASQSQFYLTDSTKHFLMGSIYFYAKPNFDSVLPAAHYVKNDLRILMESLKWKP